MNVSRAGYGGEEYHAPLGAPYLLHGPPSAGGGNYPPPPPPPLHAYNMHHHHQAAYPPPPYNYPTDRGDGSPLQYPPQGGGGGGRQHSNTPPSRGQVSGRGRGEVCLYAYV